MPRSILSLFARSPFGPVQAHMRKVNECVSLVPSLFDALHAGDFPGVHRLSGQISALEHEADQLQQEIRTNLPKSVFLPVDRGDLINFLSNQDTVADKCEDLGLLLSMRDLAVPETVKPSLSRLMERAVATARASHELVEQLDELVEASFGGPEAERVNERIEAVSKKEHETDRASYEFAKAVFAAERDMTAGELWMMLKVGQTLGDLANASERIGKRLQLMLHI